MSLQGVNTVQLGGARLITSADTGNEENDIATKRYVDWWNFPSNSYRHYIGLIKARKFTLAPLTGLMKITTDLNVKGGYIITVLESAIYPDTFYLHDQLVKDKHIQISYMFDVWVNTWDFYIQYCTSITVAFKWQASDDGHSWVDVSDAKFECISNPSTDDNNCLYVNKAQWKFTNPIRKTNKGYYHWRLKGVSGSVKSDSYINILLMEVT